MAIVRARRPEAQIVAEGLESLRRAERRCVSRVLHDEVGPSLCSAGLQLSLLRGEADDRTLDSIQEALDHAISAVRSLSYRSDPQLASRCGLRAALSYLTAGRKAKLVVDEEPADLTPQQADLLARVVRDALLATEERLQIEVVRRGIRIRGGQEFRMSAAEVAGLKRLAASLHLSASFRRVEGRTTLAVLKREAR